MDVSNKIKLYLLSEKCNIGMEMKKEKYMLLVRKRKLKFIKVCRKNTFKNRYILIFLRLKPDNYHTNTLFNKFV